MSAVDRLHNRISLTAIPFTDRGSRILLFKHEDTLLIRLAERWVKYEAQVGHYRKRPPFIEDFMILDVNGNQLTLEPDTFPHAFSLHTKIGSFTWAFVNPETLAVGLPDGEFNLRFTIHAERFKTDRRGGVTHGKRNAAYTTNAHITGHTVTALEDNRIRVDLSLKAETGQTLLLNLTPRLGFNRVVPNISAVVQAARMRWEAWFDAAPPVLPEYQAHYEYALWVMRASLFAPRHYFSREACTPSKIHYVGAWLWDQYYHALAYRHIDIRLAEDQLRLFLDHQLPNGMLPDAIHDEGLITHLTAPVDADVTKPPFMAWAALKIYESSGNLEFLQEVYEPMARWQAYWMTECLNACGLAEYHHPFSSGLDDSPLFDEGMPVVSPDLNTYLVIQAESLARIAELIDLPDAAAKHLHEADTLAERMQAVLWDEELGYFHALREGTTPVNVFTPFHLMPIWTGRMSDEQVERAVAHLTSPRLWSEWPIPTVATDDPKFDPMQMWRGPTWVNINLLFVEALNRVGKYDLARELRQRSLALIQQHSDIYEYYNPHSAERPPKSAPIFGWTSASFIELALQETRDRQRLTNHNPSA